MARTGGNIIDPFFVGTTIKSVIFMPPKRLGGKVKWKIYEPP